MLVTEGRALKHVQVREYVRTLVTGAAPGSPAPSERELVHRFGVARMTVRQAMDALVVEGLLERIPGRGTFVARPRRTASRLTSYTEEMARRGLLAESQTLLARREQAGPGVARALNVSEGDAVIHWRRLRRADGLPMCVEDAYLNEVLIPGFLQSGMPTSLYDALEARGLRPTWAEDSINADVANAEEAEQPRGRRRAPRCSGTRGAAWPARRSSRCRARSTGPTASPCGCRSAPRAELTRLAPEVPERGDDVAALLADPHRVGAAEVRLDVEHVQRSVRRSRGRPASGRRSRTARPGRPGRPARRRTARPRATARPTTCVARRRPRARRRPSGSRGCAPPGRPGRGPVRRTAGCCPSHHHASRPNTRHGSGVRRTPRPTVAAWATASSR